MNQMVFFETISAREFHESESQLETALAILRSRKLTKLSFEKDYPGARLAPAIEILRNGYGFEIAGEGKTNDPYWLLNPKQSPTKVRLTKKMKDAYYLTEHWDQKRNERFMFDSHRCVLCTGACVESLECHHIRYRPFAERLDELMTVCRYHHEIIHCEASIGWPVGVDVAVAERLLCVPVYEFEEWLLP